MFVACGLRSANRPGHNWNAAGWVALADALPGCRLLAIDNAKRPPLGIDSTEEGDSLFYEHDRVIDCTGETDSLMHVAALMSRCSAFVGIESGLLHVAHSQGLPVVFLSTSAPAKVRGPLTGPSIGFTGDESCFLSKGRGTPDANGRSMAAVTGEQVAAAVRKVLCQPA